MAKILLHTLVFAPDGVSTSILISELAQDLKAQGHQITVLTTQPHYNHDEDAEAKQPLKKHLFGLYFSSTYHGMRVVHTFMPRKGERVGGRLGDYLIFHVLSLVLGLFLVGRQDVVIAPSPPLSIGMIGWMLARLKGGRFIYNVQELYPALAVQMGLVQEGTRTYRVLKWMEHFIYARAWVVVTICEQFQRYIIDMGFPEEKILLIPNFVDLDFIQPRPKDNPLARELKLVDKYVFLYAGNIGMTQSFNTIMTVVERVRDMPDVHFLIVGDGARRSYVDEIVTERQLQNVTLMDYQPRHVVPDIYATSDAGLVPLMAGTAFTTLPSKIYTILASGRPALVSVDENSELTWIVKRGQCGLAVPPDDADALEAAIRQMVTERDKFKAYGLNGRRYVEEHYSRSSVIEKYHALMTHLEEGQAS